MINWKTYLLALESIGETSNKYPAMLFLIFYSCIQDVLRVWLRNTRALLRDDDGSSISGDRIKDLLSFLLSKIEGEERSFLVKSGFRLSRDVARKENLKKLWRLMYCLV